MQRAKIKENVLPAQTQNVLSGLEFRMDSRPEFLGKKLIKFIKAAENYLKKGSSSRAEKVIRNAIVPVSVWALLIPSNFYAKKVSSFGLDVPIGRAAQTEEIAPSYVYIASDESKFFIGQVLYPKGGKIING